VREGGLEPPRLSRWNLNPVRLPDSATLATLAIHLLNLLIFLP
jgi:hypothetical protein